MTDASLQDDWEPGRRKDASRPRSDRRRLGWRDFRRSSRGFITTLTLAVAIFVALDVFLVMRYQRYQRETQALRAAMSDVERKRTDELLAQNENRLKVMVELFRRQAFTNTGFLKKLPSLIASLMRTRSCFTTRPAPRLR